jgi:hypothetical protein
MKSRSTHGLVWAYPGWVKNKLTHSKHSEATMVDYASMAPNPSDQLGSSIVLLPEGSPAPLQTADLAKAQHFI